MTRLLIGEDSTGTECIKITKGNYDPKTTSDSLRERFFYSSKWPNQMMPPEIEPMPLVQYAGDRTVFFPAGSNKDTCGMWRIDTRAAKGGGGYNYTSTYTIRGKVRYPLLRYDMPLMELSEIKSSTGRYQQRQITEHTFGAEYGPAGVLGGYMGTGGTGSWYRRAEAFTLTDAVNVDYTTGASASTVTGTHQSLLVYNLPGNNVALDGPTSPPSPTGKMAIQITQDYCRAAKTGYDARTATPAQMAFDSTGRPLSVIAADDIAIPVGTSSYDVGVAIPDNCAVDLSCYDDTASNIFYPMKLNQDENPYGVEYWFDGNLIRFNNTRRACRARFIAYGADTLGPSSGSNKVFRQFSSGGENVAQLLRPGSADPPRWSDIILDTRRPVIQIIADGYFTVPTAPSFGVNATTVNYDATGFFPYIKYMTVHGSGLDMEVRAPAVNCRFQNSLSTGGLSGDGSYCKYNTTSATFYTAKGTPAYIYYSAGGGGSIKTVYDDKPMVGLRWFVLGIPIS